MKLYLSVLAKMMVAGNRNALDNLESESDKDLARILTEVQEREEMEVCRKQELINGMKFEYNKNYSKKYEIIEPSFDFGEIWEEKKLPSENGNTKDTLNNPQLEEKKPIITQITKDEIINKSKSLEKDTLNVNIEAPETQRNLLSEESKDSSDQITHSSNTFAQPNASSKKDTNDTLIN